MTLVSASAGAAKTSIAFAALCQTDGLVKFITKGLDEIPDHHDTAIMVFNKEEKNHFTRITQILTPKKVKGLEFKKVRLYKTLNQISDADLLYKFDETSTSS